MTTTNAANRNYAVPVYSALDASTPLLQVTNGFVGAGSDPLAQLEAAHAFTATYATADDGNLVQAAQLDLPHDRDFTLALGFGTSQADAVGAAEASLAQPFDDLREAYTQGWARYDDAPHRAATAPWRRAGQRLARPRRRVLPERQRAQSLRGQDLPRRAEAGPASPWGQAISAGDPNNTYFGSYREVFARDLYEEWTGLLADGDLQTARDAVNFLFYRQQQPDGSMPRNSLANGKTAPDSFNTQLDECSYPIIMAYQLGMTTTPTSTRTTSNRRRTSSPATARRSAPSAGRSRAATRPRPLPPRSPA